MPRNEAETRAELIDPALAAAGWGAAGSTLRREHVFTSTRIREGEQPAQLKADYMLLYKSRIPLAIVEAKPETAYHSEGMAQAKNYASKLQARWAYATNGHNIREVDMDSGAERDIDEFPSPQELWARAHANKEPNEWTQKFYDTGFYNGHNPLRYYQQIAVQRVLESIAEGSTRALLTLATGTGKTEIALQVVWNLFESRWNLQGNSNRPRVLFLCDRNILANQAFNEFSAAFREDQLARIYPDDMPMNNSIFFTIFQTLTSRDNYQQYPTDFFDLVIVDECHRGGANDESQWRGILEHFSNAVQLGLTATPKRDDNINTYQYFGEPVYTYSLKEGINDGYLTPFKVRVFTTSMDTYQYDPNDDVVEGEDELDAARTYQEEDFNRIIEMREREVARVKLFLRSINPHEKTLVFCANQKHALFIRDLVNEYKSVQEANYCERVTADDGALGEQHLKDFQDNENQFPTILTTSRKLSTGVNAKQIKNIVLLRPVHDMIEFKQIIGRGTRLYDGKFYFTIYDFVCAHERFLDESWDGEADEVTEIKPSSSGYPESVGENDPDPYEGEGGDGDDDSGDDDDDSDDESEPRPLIKIKLGKGRTVTSNSATLFYGDEGTPISAEVFLKNLYGALPQLFKDEAQLRELWSEPTTRAALLVQLAEHGITDEKLTALKEVINAKDKDLYDVLAFIAYNKNMHTRQQRAATARTALSGEGYTQAQKEFLEFVLKHYESMGEAGLHADNFETLIRKKYTTLPDAADELGDITQTQQAFIALQKALYHEAA